MSDLSSRRSSNSNLERFLDCTIPSVPVKFLQKECINKPKLWGTCEGGSCEYFRLDDLWNCYDEWSAYGAGVPIFLKNKETVVQFYVPYLSALQIYTSSSNRSLSEYRNLRDEVECCDYELRDSSSGETSSEDSECAANLSERSLSTRSFNCSEKSVSWDTASEESVGDHENSWRPPNRLGNLYVEYFEHSPPYARVPLMQKINQLRRGYPGLNSLRSIDLSAASWMSVAWYPIYHIPTSPTVRDLSACFLTYHTLSSSFQDNDNLTANGDGTKDWAGYIGLPPFGAATYKLQGQVWHCAGERDRKRLYSLWSSALSWLNQLQVQHPDFHFFLRHRE